ESIPSVTVYKKASLATQEIPLPTESGHEESHHRCWRQWLHWPLANCQTCLWKQRCHCPDAIAGTSCAVYPSGRLGWAYVGRMREKTRRFAGTNHSRRAIGELP